MTTPEERPEGLAAFVRQLRQREGAENIEAYSVRMEELQRELEAISAEPTEPTEQADMEAVRTDIAKLKTFVMDEFLQAETMGRVHAYDLKAEIKALPFWLAGTAFVVIIAVALINIFV